MAGHYVMKCKHGIVMGQCRCPSENKTVKTVGCGDSCEPEKHPLFPGDCPECRTRHPKGWACPKRIATLEAENAELKSAKIEQAREMDARWLRFEKLEKSEQRLFEERDELRGEVERLRGTLTSLRTYVADPDTVIMRAITNTIDHALAMRWPGGRRRGSR